MHTRFDVYQRILSVLVCHTFAQNDDESQRRDRKTQQYCRNYCVTTEPTEFFFYRPIVRRARIKISVCNQTDYFMCAGIPQYYTHSSLYTLLYFTLYATLLTVESPMCMLCFSLLRRCWCRCLFHTLFSFFPMIIIHSI